MEYTKNEICEHCGAEIEEIKVLHGFAFDIFICPHCGEQNKRY